MCSNVLVHGPCMPRACPLHGPRAPLSLTSFDGLVLSSLHLPDTDKSTCDVICVARFLSLLTTILLIVTTAFLYGITLTNSTEIVAFFADYVPAFADSAPNLILTVVKTLVPVVVALLVDLEAYSNIEKVCWGGVGMDLEERSNIKEASILAQDRLAKVPARIDQPVTAQM